MSQSDPSPRTVRLLTALLLLVTFAAGTVTGGALVHRFTERTPPAHPMHGMGPMPWERLNLTQAQQKQAHEILERYRPKLDSVFLETAPKVKAITDEVDREIRAILTPEQQSRFDHILAERRKGPPRPPPDMRPPPGVGPPFPGPPGMGFGMPPGAGAPPMPADAGS